MTQTTLSSCISFSTISTIFLTVLTLLLINPTCSTPQQISYQIPTPQYSQNKIPLSQITADSNKSITISFPDITFEISSKLYTFNDKLQQYQQVYDPSIYTDSTQNCNMYQTSLFTQSVAKLLYSQNVTNLKYVAFLNNNIINDGNNNNNNNMNKFYVLGSDSKLYIYNFDKNNITSYGNYDIDLQITGIQNGILSKGNVQLLIISGRLFLVNINSMYYFNQKNKPVFTKLSGYQTNSQIVDIGIIKQNNQLSGSQIWVATARTIVTYNMMQTDIVYASKIQQYSGSIPDSISAITYCSVSQHFYIVAGRNLYIQKLLANTPIKQYQVNGLCTKITKINRSLYLSCQYQRINFITQLRIQQLGQQLILNRYYDEDTISGVRQVQSIGYDKIALIGDQQAVIIGQAINRKLLLDLQDIDQQQNYQFVYSFSMYDFYYLKQYSTIQHSQILVVSQSGISMHKLVFQSPELQCVFHKPKQNKQDSNNNNNNNNNVISLLAVFNTTHCPFMIQQQFQKTGTQIYCQTYYPITIQLNKKQYQQKTANFIFFVIMLILTVLILICAGCGVQIRKKANLVIQNLRQKIEKVRINHQQSELKKI